MLTTSNQKYNRKQFFKHKRRTYMQKPATKTHQKIIFSERKTGSMFHTNNGFSLGSRAKHESEHGNMKAIVELRLTDENTKAIVELRLTDENTKAMVELRLTDRNTKAWMVNTTNDQRRIPKSPCSLFFVLQCKLRTSEMRERFHFPSQIDVTFPNCN